MNNNAKGKGTVRGSDGGGALLQTILTVPELIYLFFFIFFLGFITWWEAENGEIMRERER